MSIYRILEVSKLCRFLGKNKFLNGLGSEQNIFVMLNMDKIKKWKLEKISASHPDLNPLLLPKACYINAPHVINRRDFLSPFGLTRTICLKNLIKNQTIFLPEPKKFL